MLKYNIMRASSNNRIDILDLLQDSFIFYLFRYMIFRA
jgi:hypothetical protein